MNIDMHIHSNYSDDGELSVEEIIDLSIQKKMRYISITDHNSIKGVGKAMSYSKNKEINIIAGIEIDCNYKDIDFHLLGYGIDYTDNQFLELESFILKQEREKALEKIHRCYCRFTLSNNRQNLLSTNCRISCRLNGSHSAGI